MWQQPIIPQVLNIFSISESFRFSLVTCLYSKHQFSFIHELENLDSYQWWLDQWWGGKKLCQITKCNIFRLICLNTIYLLINLHIAMLRILFIVMFQNCTREINFVSCTVIKLSLTTPSISKSVCIYSTRYFLNINDLIMDS